MNSQFLRKMSEVACDILHRMQDVNDVQTKRGLMALLLTLCRNMEDVAPRNASKAAQARADELDIGDLRQYHWDDGGRFPGGRKSSRLHWEHWKPAVDIRTELLLLEKPTIDDVEKILGTARVCWILLEENSVLNENGHRTRRKDPSECYKKANIGATVRMVTDT